VTLLVITLIALSVLLLGTGTIAYSPPEILDALTGQTQDTRAAMVIVQWRLPRLLFALMSGAALALSGAIFQSLTKNPLGSPDIIGFSTGSYTGALVVMLWFGSMSYYEIAGGALLGGAVVALVVYLLSMKDGVQAFRLIIVGIGNSLMLMQSSTQNAMLASVWGSGTLSSLGFEQLRPASLIFVVLLIATLGVLRRLGHLEMGDDAAAALGVDPGPTRAYATACGVGLTAIVTAAVGPISFIALAAPQIALRLTKGTGVQLWPVMLTGACVLALADLIAQLVRLPVGVVTVSVGGIYLVWLLVQEFGAGRK
jgi:iron complex transport system permease protein